MRRVIACCAVAVVLGLTLPAAAVVFVSPDGDDSLSGGSWAKAKLTIQAGIDAAAANGGDVVRVMGGTYDGGILLRDGVTLRGGFTGSGTDRDIAGNPSIIDAGQLGTAIKVDLGATATIDGFEIDNGWANYGGGIYANSADLTVKNTSFYYNFANYCGGAIYAVYSLLTVDKCYFEQNGADLYGGAICSSRGEASITRSTFIQNYAHCGAAFDTDYAVASVFANNTVEGNTADYGAGISARWKSDVSILNNTFADNEGAYGGAMYIYYSPVLIANNLIARNTVSAKGGGIYVASYSSADVINNTIVANHADIQGGGMIVLYKAAVFVGNSIFRGNSAPEGGAAYKDVYSVVDIFSTCVNGNGTSQLAGGVKAPAARGNITTSPGFVDFVNGDYHLTLTSNCVDAGNDSYVDPSWTDLDGNPRLAGTVDMGCYELP